MTDVSWAQEGEWQSATFAIRLAAPPTAQPVYQFVGQAWAALGESVGQAAALSLVMGAAQALDPARPLARARPTWQARSPSPKQIRWLAHAFPAEEWERIEPYVTANRGTASLMISWLRVRDGLTRAGLWAAAEDHAQVVAALDAGHAGDAPLATKAARELTAWLAELAAEPAPGRGLVDAEPGAGLSSALRLAALQLPDVAYCRIDAPRIAAPAFGELVFEVLCGPPLFGGIALDEERRRAILAMAAPGTLLLLDNLATTRAAIGALLDDLQARGVSAVVAAPTAAAAKLAKAFAPTRRHTFGLVTRGDVERLVLPMMAGRWGLTYDAGEADWLADELFRLAKATRESGVTWLQLEAVLAIVARRARSEGWRQLLPDQLAALPRLAAP
ncbi:MAG TPA: hypothetical protein VGE07_02985 [Herpetosiphonaceae bacterium]